VATEGKSAITTEAHVSVPIRMQQETNGRTKPGKSTPKNPRLLSQRYIVPQIGKWFPNSAFHIGIGGKVKRGNCLSAGARGMTNSNARRCSSLLLTCACLISTKVACDCMGTGTMVTNVKDPTRKLLNSGWNTHSPLARMSCKAGRTTMVY